MNEYFLFNLAYPFFAASVLWILKFLLPSFIIDAYVSFACLLLTSALVYHGFRFAKKQYWTIRVLPRNKAVLITGCDSGFGHLLAKRLDSRGFHVFATCLFPDGEGAKKLKETCSSRLHVLKVDVTNDDDVKKAFDYVQSNLGTCELWAVVNNAGIQEGFAVHWTNLESFKKVLDVNTLGPVRVTKAFLSLLQRSKGRVVTVVSIAGRIATPSLTPYTMSKFAAAAFTECLRLELLPWGIRSISIEPESFKTGICRFDVIKKNIDEIVQNLDEDIKADYGEAYFKDFTESTKNILKIFHEKPDLVVDCMEDAVSLEQPNDVYQPCRNAFVSFILYIAQCLPKPFLERIIRIGMYINGCPSPIGAEYNF